MLEENGSRLRNRCRFAFVGVSVRCLEQTPYRFHLGRLLPEELPFLQFSVLHCLRSDRQNEVHIGLRNRDDRTLNGGGEDFLCLPRAPSTHSADLLAYIWCPVSSKPNRIRKASAFFSESPEPLQKVRRSTPPARSKMASATERISWSTVSIS